MRGYAGKASNPEVLLGNGVALLATPFKMNEVLENVRPSLPGH